MEKLSLPESEWRARLTPEQYHVLREAGTERAFAGIYNDKKADGIYACAACGKAPGCSNAAQPSTHIRADSNARTSTCQRRHRARAQRRADTKT